jgi:ribosome-associated protein
MREIDFELRGAFIPLDALLKATGLAESGGRAKAMVTEGLVQVDGQAELRKTCKVRAGQSVTLAGARICVRAAAAPDGTEAADGVPCGN